MESQEIASILERQERQRCLLTLQERAEAEGQIPPRPFLLLRAMARPLHYVGGILLGIFLGVLTLLLNFYVFVWLFHLNL